MKHAESVEELREATGKYTQGGGTGRPAPGVEEEARPLFLADLDALRRALPAGIDYGDWRRLSNIDLEDRSAMVYGYLSETDERREEFLQAEARLTKSFLLVKHLDDCRPFADEVIYYQRTRNQLLKTLPGEKRRAASVEAAVRDLVDESIESEGVVDIFRAAGLERADISILDERFLQTFKDRPFENLRLKLLEKLLADEIQARGRRSLARARSFRQLLEQTLQNYHNRLIDAATVVKTMVEMRREMEESDERAAALNLNGEELAFYEAVAENYQQAYGQELLRDLVHDVTQTIKRNLKVEWTEPHREDVKAAIRAAVKRVLRLRKIKPEDFDPFLSFIMEQASALYADFPMAA